jgi:cell division protein FtsI/penicillin-binding protein 2
VVQWLLFACWVALFGRVGWLQLFRWQHYRQEAARQHWEKDVLLAERGRVYDRLGRPLSLNRTVGAIRICPKYATDRDTLADILASFGLCDAPAMRQELRRRDRMFWFRRDLDYAVAESLRLVLERRHYSNCAEVLDRAQRHYPFGPECAPVVGFVGDEQGLAGIEAEYDSTLRGRNGWMLLQREARYGATMPMPSYPVDRPMAGADIQLTLDLDVQGICYRALAEQVDATGALKGSAVVLDARTGAVLGMSDYPSYDPERFDGAPKERYKCTAVADQFEPGSSFKLVIAAAALESPNAKRLLAQHYDVSAGFIQIGKYRIKDVHPNGVLDFAGLIVKSSNPGCALLSMQVEPELYYQVARGLGFASAVGLGLPGEGPGSLDRPERLNTLRFANVVFGQGVTVTLLQLAAAYLCVANDGEYLRPYLIASVRQGGRTLREFRPTALRRVMRPENARALQDILERVVTEGTGTMAQVSGVPVCGKTGTAQKIEPGGGYSGSRSRMTFVGFFPKEEPRYVVAVLIDEPRTVRFAGSTSCPAFKHIAEQLVRLDRMRERMETGVVLAGRADERGRAAKGRV